MSRLRPSTPHQLTILTFQPGTKDLLDNQKLPLRLGKNYQLQFQLQLQLHLQLPSSLLLSFSTVEPIQNVTPVAIHFQQLQELTPLDNIMVTANLVIKNCST